MFERLKQLFRPPPGPPGPPAVTGYKDSGDGPNLPIAVSSMFAGLPINRFIDFESYLEAGSRKVWASWKACDIVSTSVMNTPRNVLRNKKPVIIKELEALLTIPNIFETFPEMLYKIVMHLKLTGNAYVLKDATSMGFKRPAALYTLNPKRVRIALNGIKTIKGYLYNANGQSIPIEPDEMIHFRVPHPNREWYGIGEIEAGEPLFNDRLNTDQWTERFWANGANPTGILICEDQITDQEAWEKAKAQFQKLYGGVANSGKVAWLTGKWRYEQMGLTAQEMQNIEAQRLSIENIFLMHGVPLSVAGIREAANFACLPASQLVNTPTGPVSIASLKKGDPIWQMSKDGLETQKVTAIKPQGLATTFRITSLNRTIEASENHPILVVDFTEGIGRGPHISKKREAKLAWRRTDQIKTGDYLVTWEEGQKEGAYCFENKPLTIGFMELAGLFTGDGDYQIGGCFRWAIHRNDNGAQSIYAAKATEEFKSLPAGSNRIGNGPSGAKCHLTHFAIHSVALGEIYKRMGLLGDSKTKTIPKWIFSLHRDLKLAYLRGLLDSDGSVDKTRGQIAFGWANQHLASQVRALCMDCGIPVNNLKVYRGIGNFGPITLWRFNCGYRNANMRIGSNHPKKLARLVAGGKGQMRSGCGIIGRWPFKGTGFTLPPGFGVSKVMKVEKIGEKEVFDLCTEGTHTFIAEGIVVHNTADIDNQRFREYTVYPKVQLIQDRLNAQLVKDWGDDLSLKFIVSGLTNPGKVLTDFAPLFDRGGITINELREKVGLERDDSNPLWNQTYISSTLVPLELSGVQDQGQTAQQASAIVNRFIQAQLEGKS